MSITHTTRNDMAEFYGAAAGAQAKNPDFSSVHPETGEIRPGPAEMISSARARRYALLGAIRRIDPTHRTARCAWSRVSTGAQINVIRDSQTGKARYSGLMACSRVWTCPCCAAKISERRAAELAAAIGQARTLDLHVSLLTVTVPHVRQDDLKTLIQSLGTAWRSFSTGRVSARLRAEIGLVGTIRNIEVTHGENGWHPHFHCLLIHKAPVGPDQIKSVEAAWGAHWQHCAVKAGLRRPSDEHGLTLQAGDYAARYVSKWGLEHEMTKSMAKRSRRAGRTPFDIAEDYADGIDTARNAGLWRTFAAAMHGQRQLFWSKGLKALLQVREADDEALCAEEDERPAELVIQLTMPEWCAVRARHRAMLLDLAERAPELIRPWLDGLIEPPSEPPPEPRAGLHDAAGSTPPILYTGVKEGGATPPSFTGERMGGVSRKAGSRSVAEGHSFRDTRGPAPGGQNGPLEPPEGWATWSAHSQDASHAR